MGQASAHTAFCAVPSPGLCPRGNSPGGRLHLIQSRECRASLLDGGYFCLKLGQDPGELPGSEWELPGSHGSLAMLSLALCLPAPPRRAPADASAGCCLANLANSTDESGLRLVWGKTEGALMEGHGPLGSQAGQHPGGVPQPLLPAPRPRSALPCRWGLWFSSSLAPARVGAPRGKAQCL